VPQKLRPQPRNGGSPLLLRLGTSDFETDGAGVCGLPDRSPPEIPTSTTPFPAAPLFRKHERIDDACRRIIATLDFYSVRSIHRIGIPT